MGPTNKNAAAAYFGKYRIIEEKELSFCCSDEHPDGEVQTWFSLFQWTFIKHVGDLPSLHCDSAWTSGSEILADVHFHCLPKDEPAKRCTRKLVTMRKGLDVVAADEMQFDGPAIWRVYIRLLKEWDIPYDRFTNPATDHTLIYRAGNRRFYANRSTMCAASSVIRKGLEQVGITGECVVDHQPDGFNVFLHAIDFTDPVLPSPDTLTTLCHYAGIYEINQLLEQCEKHLMHCHDMAITHRLLLAAKYELKNAQGYLSGLLNKSELKRIQQEENAPYEELCNEYPQFVITFFNKSLLSP